MNGTYVELSYADEDKRRAEVAKVLSQIPVAKVLHAGCMGSETTNMAKQPGVTRKEAQEALLRSLGEILPVCEEQGVLFAVECVYYHAMNTPEAVKMVLDTIASPNLRVICDLANYVGPRERLGGRTAPPLGQSRQLVRRQDRRPSTSRVRTSSPTAPSTPPASRTPVWTYKGGFEMLRALPQPVLPVLREEAVPARAASDLAFMKSFSEFSIKR